MGAVHSMEMEKGISGLSHMVKAVELLLGLVAPPSPGILASCIVALVSLHLSSSITAK